MVTGWLLSGCGESATELYSQAQTAEKNGLSQVEVAALYQKSRGCRLKRCMALFVYLLP